MTEATETSMVTFIGLILGILIVALILGPAIVKLVQVHLSSSDFCEDGGKQSWEKLVPILNKLDSKTPRIAEISFVKGECDLVTFSSKQGYSYLLSLEYYSESPQVCLCEIKGEECNTELCYKFEKLNDIEKFSTIDSPSNTFIKLSNQDEILKIEKVVKDQ